MFTSPVPDQMLEATKGVDGGAGVLHIVKNYTGDVMNFDMAAELAAAETGVEVTAIVTADDVAVQDSLYTAGRRGVGVTVLVEKIAGAAAEERRPLAEVAAVARRVSESGRSMGVALTSCTVPAVGHPTFDLPEDQIEVGIGIHGEPGRRRIPLASAHEIAELLVTPVLDDLEHAETFPALIDPKFKKAVEDEVSQVTHDLPIEINDRVLGFLEYYQKGRGRTTMELGLERAGRYQPMIEKILKEEGVPLDLIYLCQVESAFQPRALSRAAAKGIPWHQRGSADLLLLRLPSALLPEALHGWPVDQEGVPKLVEAITFRHEALTALSQP